MRKKVITFGEIMLRLNPHGYERFIQADTLCMNLGGAEANVAVALAQLGDDVSFITKLPAHELGQFAINGLRRYGVGVDGIIRGGNRIGIYYLEKGASQRPSKVIYDRAGSSIAEAERTDFFWAEAFAEADWFHFTGITPALSDKAADICKDACYIAKKLGLTISCDLNFRKKLWSRDKACKVMSELLPYVDVLIANEEDAKDVFGIEAADSHIESGRLNREGYCSVAVQLDKMFDLRAVAITLRESISASENNWSGMLYTKGEAYYSPTYHLTIVDRVGGGDSFGAGLIHAMRHNKNNQEVIDYAVAASCLKHSIEGDWNLITDAEVMALVSGNVSGRVQR